MRYLSLLIISVVPLPLYRKQTSRPLSGAPARRNAADRSDQNFEAHATWPWARPSLRGFIQRVPVSTNSYLPHKVEVVGKVVNYGPSSLSILFYRASLERPNGYPVSNRLSPGREIWVIWLIL